MHVTQIYDLVACVRLAYHGTGNEKILLPGRFSPRIMHAINILGRMDGVRTSTVLYCILAAVQRTVWYSTKLVVIPPYCHTCTNHHGYAYLRFCAVLTIL